VGDLGRRLGQATEDDQRVGLEKCQSWMLNWVYYYGFSEIDYRSFANKMHGHGMRLNRGNPQPNLNQLHGFESDFQRDLY
jgi:hypothetical protein